MKFCKDCKFSSGPDKFAKCTNSHKASDNFLVAGNPINGHYCSVSRGSERLCGPTARWFVPKDDVESGPIPEVPEKRSLLGRFNDWLDRRNK